MAEVALRSIAIAVDRDGVTDAGDAAMSLNVVGIRLLDDGQRDPRICNDVLRVLRDRADVDHRPAHSIHRVRRHRTERISADIQRDGRQNTEALTEKKTSCRILFDHFLILQAYDSQPKEE